MAEKDRGTLCVGYGRTVLQLGTPPSLLAGHRRAIRYLRRGIVSAMRIWRQLRDLKIESRRCSDVIEIFTREKLRKNHLSC